MRKLSIAIEQLTTCGGCENSILNLGDELIVLLEKNLEIVYAPILMDSNRPQHVDIVILSGAVRTEDDLKKVKYWKGRCNVAVAFGSCACFGGIPGLSNLSPSNQLLESSYINQIGTINPAGSPPTLNLPKLTDFIKPVSELINVDYELPGCPPPPELIREFFISIVEGREFRLPNKSVCDECPLNTGESKEMKSVKRWPFGEIDRNKCLLEQGFICLGPVTRGGCNAQCIRAGYPCRGCLGPLDKSIDGAAKMISVIASSSSLIDVSIEDLGAIPDLVGLFYRFTLPISAIKPWLWRKRH